MVATVYADGGPTAKRIRPRAQGRAYRIKKRTTHITVVVSRPPRDQRAGQSTGRGARRAASQPTAPPKKAAARRRLE